MLLAMRPGASWMGNNLILCLCFSLPSKPEPVAACNLHVILDWVVGSFLILIYSVAPLHGDCSSVHLYIWAVRLSEYMRVVALQLNALSPQISTTYHNFDNESNFFPLFFFPLVSILFLFLNIWLLWRYLFAGIFEDMSHFLLVSDRDKSIMGVCRKFDLLLCYSA